MPEALLDDLGVLAVGLDARVLQVLQLASQTYTLRISSLQTGHSRCIAGTAGDECRVSHHWHGRAVDISAVNGIPVRSDNAAAMALAQWIGGLPPKLLPSEIGSPWRRPEASGDPLLGPDARQSSPRRLALRVIVIPLVPGIEPGHGFSPEACHVLTVPQGH